MTDWLDDWLTLWLANTAIKMQPCCSSHDNIKNIFFARQPAMMIFKNIFFACERVSDGKIDESDPDFPLSKRARNDSRKDWPKVFVEEQEFVGWERNRRTNEKCNGKISAQSHSQTTFTQSHSQAAMMEECPTCSVECSKGAYSLQPTLTRHFGTPFILVHATLTGWTWTKIQFTQYWVVSPLTCCLSDLVIHFVSSPIGV